MTRSFSSLLSVLTLAVSVNSLAAASAPANPVVISGGNVNIVGFVNINNFQGNGLNLVDNNPAGILNLTAVTSFPPGFSGQSNQQWQFRSTGVPNQFIIQNGIAPWLLSFPAAPIPNGNPFGGQAVVYSNVPAVFNVTSTNPPGLQIIEVKSKLALTAWPQTNGNPSLSSPVTLESQSSALAPQQVWTITAAPIDT